MVAILSANDPNVIYAMYDFDSGLAWNPFDDAVAMNGELLLERLKSDPEACCFRLAASWTAERR